MSAPEYPDIVAGRRVRRIDLDVSAGLRLTVLEAADADAVLEESVRADGDPYAATLWPSAIAAASRLNALIEPDDVVLDLGSGTGLVALAAAFLGARAIALDHDPFAREVIIRAAAAQALDVDVRDFDVRGDAPLPEADLVVIADLLYEPELARAAAHRALEALERGSHVLVGDPVRYGRVEFEQILDAAGVDTVFEDIVVGVPGEPRPARVGLALLAPETQHRSGS